MTGGYYQTRYKDVERPWELGFPIAEVNEKGEAIITKVEDQGKYPYACKEQFLYEIHDLSQYLTPDGVADFTGVQLEQTAKIRSL